MFSTHVLGTLGSALHPAVTMGSGLESPGGGKSTAKTAMSNLQAGGGGHGATAALQRAELEGSLGIQLHVTGDDNPP